MQYAKCTYHAMAWVLIGTVITSSNRPALLLFFQFDFQLPKERFIQIRAHNFIYFQFRAMFMTYPVVFLVNILFAKTILFKIPTFPLF